MPNIFDSHAHYDDPVFDPDRKELLGRLFAESVCHVVNIGADLETSRASIRLAKEYPQIHATVGIHPGSVKDAPPDALAQLEALLTEEKVVAVGEIGLDYYYDDNAPRQVQKEFFRAQLALAKQYDLPVVIHDRDAHGDTMELLREYRPKGVVHCFSGSVEMAREVVSLGMYLGLGGAVTFKNARVPVEVAAAMPLSSLLVETDAPYMAPVPFRGKRCDSSMIAYTAEKIASARSMATGIAVTPEEILSAARENASRLFGIALEEGLA